MKREKQQKRQYSPIYEKLVPISLILLGALVIAVIVVIFLVVLGFNPFIG